MNHFSLIMTTAAKSIACIGLAPLVPVVALMWCVALLAEEQGPEITLEVAQNGGR